MRSQLKSNLALIECISKHKFFSRGFSKIFFSLPFECSFSWTFVDVSWVSLPKQKKAQRSFRIYCLLYFSLASNYKLFLINNLEVLLNKFEVFLQTLITDGNLKNWNDKVDTLSIYSEHFFHARKILAHLACNHEALSRCFFLYCTFLKNGMCIEFIQFKLNALSKELSFAPLRWFLHRWFSSIRNYHSFQGWIKDFHELVGSPTNDCCLLYRFSSFLRN